MTTVSVVVPIYNGQNCVEFCIEQLKNQTISNLEVIIVDDGSTDSTVERCEKAIEGLSSFRLIKKQHAGVSAARNAGVLAAEGQYVGFVDVDDSYDNDLFEKMYNLAAAGEYDLVLFENVGKPGETNLLTKETALKEFYLSHISLAVWRKLFKRELIQNIMFPEKIRIYEDCYTTYKAILESQKIICKNITKYHYLRDTVSSTRSAFTEKYFDAIRVIDDVFLDTMTRYGQSQMVSYALTKKMHVYIRIFKLFVLRGQPEDCRDQAMILRDEIISVNKSKVRIYLDFKNKCRMKMIVYCPSFFRMVTNVIDKN